MTVHSIMLTLVCGERHLQILAILFLVTVANTLIANGNEKQLLNLSII